MTNEEKVRAYDEALKRAKNQRSDYQKELDKTDKNSQLAGLLQAGISVIDMIFPELCKSENEKIMEELIGALMWQRDCLDAKGPHDNNLILPGFTMKVGDILAYLEKQKEQKSVVTINGESIPIENQSVDIPLSEWSKKDDAFLKVAIAICNKYSHKDIADWLKFLPERFNLKPKH